MFKIKKISFIVALFFLIIILLGNIGSVIAYEGQNEEAKDMALKLLDKYYQDNYNVNGVLFRSVKTVSKIKKEKFKVEIEGYAINDQKTDTESYKWTLIIEEEGWGNWYLVDITKVKVELELSDL